jgi:methylmalonyl-CoA mutase
VSKDKLSGTV